MLRNALFSLLVLIVGKSYAQQDYFVLIQSDNSQPFYIRLGDKSLSSTPKGRLILSQLKEGSHSFTLGFPKQLFPDQQFSFNIGEKDLEFQLKDLGEKGWGLFNPQTLELKMADKKEEAPVNKEGVKKDDAFSRLMAGVVSDTVVMYNTYAMEEALKDSPVVKVSAKIDSSGASSGAAPVTGGDTVVSVNTTAVRIDSAVGVAANPPLFRRTDSAMVRVDSPARMQIPEIASPARQDSVVAATRVRMDNTTPADLTNTASTPPLRSLVVKLSERKTPKGLRLAFADRTKGRKADTIIVIIPMDSGLTVSQAKPEKPRQGVDTTKAISGASPILSKTAEAVRNKPDSAHLPSRGEVIRNKPDSGVKKAAAKPTVINSDCRNFASDYDVDRLRVKMLESGKDEDRIQTARKIFKTKCFTTKQIKALSEVFTSDAGKYRFFEAAYPFVSDDRFRELTDLLADPVYNGKFRTMTGQQ